MHIVTVYPIIKGAFKEELTYWSSHSFSIGSIIEVPLRGRSIPALVSEVTHASNAKSQVKQASFVTRKIEKTKELDVVQKECILASVDVSKTYTSSLGSILKACIPTSILEDSIESKKKRELSVRQKNSTAVSDVLVFQTNTEDRMGTYKSIVREEFARKRSVLIIAPTVMSVNELHSHLQKGIEEHVVTLHGNLTKKKQVEVWNSTLDREHPVLIICTPLFASIPRTDIQTLILERESSRAYSSIRPPYIDFREYIERYTKHLGARLIYGDTFLRVETLYRREQGELSDFFPVSYRVEKNAELIVVDTSKPKEKKGFQVFSEELTSMIEYTEKKSSRMFIFTSRRGLSPQTVCGDCGKTVACLTCNAPIVLHQKKAVQTSDKSQGHNPLGIDPNRFFLCHHCGTERSAVEACSACGSWKLVTLGIGIETVAEELKRHFPKRDVYRLDKDTVQTDKQALAIISEFEKTKDGILLGTESSLAFLPHVEYSAIASLDSLFSIPDFKIHERIAHTLLRIIEKTEKYVLIQTRNPKNTVLKHIQAQNILGLYREEISLRKQLQYPPFVTHIKISVEDTKHEATEKIKKLQALLEDFEQRHSIKIDTLLFPAFVPGARGKSTLHLLLSIKQSSWPDEHIRSLLSSLPKEYQIRVNPESLL